MPRLRHVVREIHRRSLWQVVGIYLAGSWVALQVVGEMSASLGLPAWVRPSAVALLVVGFPIVLATAFVQEGAPRRATETDPDDPSEDRPASSGTGSQGEHEKPERSVRAGDSLAGRVLTWPRAILGGVAAFALLGLGTAGFMTMRTLGVGPPATLIAKGVLNERARILVTNFQSEAADRELARTATEAFRIDFGQSQVVRPVQPAEVAEALERMERDRDTPLDPDLARELAIREGLPAYVTGDVNTAGTAFVLSAALVETETGEILVPARETAEDSTRVIEAIDRLSSRLRERIGESLRQIRREPPLEQVTTGSLAALRKYSQAIHAIDGVGEEERGIALLEEAVSLDTAFAMAYRKLGVVLANRFQERARQVDALERAFRHRDRLTERERYHAEAGYYFSRTGEVEKAITAYRNLLQLDPRDPTALNNLGVLYSFLRDAERALEFYLRAVRADSSVGVAFRNVVSEQIKLGRIEDARASLERYSTRFPDDPMTKAVRAMIAAMEGDHDAAEEQILALRRRMAGSLYWRWQTSRDLWALDMVRGRLAEADAHMADAMEAQADRGLPGEYLVSAIERAWALLSATGDRELALGILDAALGRHPLPTLHPLDRPYARLAAIYAQAGNPGRARSLLREYEGEVEPELRGWQEDVHLNVARGEIALAEGRPGDALEAFREADRGFCEVCAKPDIGRAHEALGRADSAVAAYERYVETPWLWRLRIDDHSRLVWILERLGELHDELGDREKAARHYARFAELWADADPELQPRVRVARQRVTELSRSSDVAAGAN